jgi:hypothetical protein
MILAIINGAARDLLYLSKLGKEKAHALSTLTLMIVILIFTIVFQKLKYIENLNESMLIGVWWFILTLAFEFLAGHYLFKRSWKELLENYKINEGKLWILIPIEVLIVNYVVYIFNN